MNLIHSLNQIQWSKLSPIHKQPLLRHCSSLREYTIQAMSNMLTANIDSGLIHAIGNGPTVPTYVDILLQASLCSPTVPWGRSGWCQVDWLLERVEPNQLSLTIGGQIESAALARMIMGPLLLNYCCV